MVAYVTYVDELTKKEADITWYVGSPLKNGPSWKNLVMIQADCDELASIINYCVNLPHTKGRVQLWHGDLAQLVFCAIEDLSQIIPK